MLSLAIKAGFNEQFYEKNKEKFKKLSDLVAVSERVNFVNRTYTIDYQEINRKVRSELDMYAIQCEGLLYVDPTAEKYIGYNQGVKDCLFKIRGRI